MGKWRPQVEFIENIPEGLGPAIVDEAFDAKPILNDLVFKRYIPIVKPGSPALKAI